MKLGKAVWTEIITQIVAVATIVVTLLVAPDWMELAIAIIVALEGIALALVAHFVEAEVARVAKLNNLRM